MKLAQELKLPLELLAELTPRSKFTDDQERLYSLMSDYSEDTTHAGWIHDNEFEIWGFLFLGRPQPWRLSDYEVDLLKQIKALSEKLGGWIVYLCSADSIGENGPHFATLDQWKQILKIHEGNSSQAM